MNENTPPQIEMDNVPEALVETRRRISIVWLIPIIAALIGGWLTYKTLSEKGPSITIKFKSAEGLDAGETRIKYKDVEVGQVKKIYLSKDLTHVVVEANMVKGSESYLTENTKFWVIRPRVGATGVSGLGTLFSGAYIGLEPGRSDKQATEFRGLEEPPAIRSYEAGRRFTLKAKKRGALKIGSSVYFSDFRVGQITDIGLVDNNHGVELQVFIKKPHYRLVRENSRFWNTSGVEVSVNTDGVDVQISSLETLIAGGIAFDAPDPEAKQATASTVFNLHDNHASIGAPIYTDKISYVMYFKDSIRGLNVGAPVEFRGVKVGTVRDIKLEFDGVTGKPHIPVVIDLEPERVPAKIPDRLSPVNLNKEQARIAIESLIEEQGFRAQLATGSLLTGKLYVALDFFPDSPPLKIKTNGAYPEFPTVPTTLDEFKNAATNILADINNLPLDEIAQNVLGTTEGLNRLANDPELANSIRTANATLASIDKLTKDIDKEIVPLASQARNTLAMIDEDSPMHTNLNDTLQELAEAARSIRVLTEYLKQYPNSLIYGKE